VIPGVWFDEELGVECSFRVAGDGQRRCLPAAGFGTTDPGDPTDHLFDMDDTTCSEPLVIHGGGSSPCPNGDSYGVTPSADACVSGPATLHRIGASYSKAMVRWSSAQTPCADPADPSSFIGSGEELYTATTVPLASFVAASIE
jgi:hypothetical protein